MASSINYKKRGFSVIELLMVIAIMGVVTAGYAVFTSSFRAKNDLATATLAVVQAIHVARSQAMAANGNSGWGVSINKTGQAIVFMGGPLSSTTPLTNAQYYPLPTDVSIGGLGEYDMSKFAGTTTAATTTLYLLGQHSTTTIVVNSQGIVSY